MYCNHFCNPLYKKQSKKQNIWSYILHRSYYNKFLCNYLYILFHKNFYKFLHILNTFHYKLQHNCPHILMAIIHRNLQSLLKCMRRNNLLRKRLYIRRYKHCYKFFDMHHNNYCHSLNKIVNIVHRNLFHNLQSILLYKFLDTY